MSLFEDIFGPSPFSSRDRDTSTPPFFETGSRRGILFDRNILDGEPRVFAFDGKLYQITAVELDTSQLKPKKHAESTSAADSRAPQSEGKNA